MSGVETEVRVDRARHLLGILQFIAKKHSRTTN